MPGSAAVRNRAANPCVSLLSRLVVATASDSADQNQADNDRDDPARTGRFSNDFRLAFFFDHDRAASKGGRGGERGGQRQNRCSNTFHFQFPFFHATAWTHRMVPHCIGFSELQAGWRRSCLTVRTCTKDASQFRAGMCCNGLKTGFSKQGCVELGRKSGSDKADVLPRRREPRPLDERGLIRQVNNDSVSRIRTSNATATCADTAYPQVRQTLKTT
jgi:hypothetical protein